MGIILPLGLICNTLSFVVFVTSKALIKTSTGHYLVALSIADWLFLVGDFIRWLHTASPLTSDFYLDVDFMFTNDVVCKLTHFVRYGSKLASAWTTVAITVERFISVRWPLHAHQMSTVSRARLVIAATYVTCFTLGAYPLWTVAVAPYGPEKTACRIVKPLSYKTWSWVSLRIGSLLLPGILMLVFTGLIVLSLAKAKDQRLTRLSYRRPSPGARINNSVHRIKHNVQRQLTAILLAVGISFILLRLPYTVTYYLNNYKKHIWKPMTKTRSVNMYTINKVADVVATSNYAINFFLYCFCGSAFRGQLKALTCSWRSNRHKSSGYSATASFSLSERTSPYQTRSRS